MAPRETELATVKHRVGIRGSAEDIHRKLHHPDELTTWWATRASGLPELGGRLELEFAELAILTFEIRALEPPGLVRLECIEGPGPWKNSTLDVQIRKDEDQAFVTLTHTNPAASEEDFLYFSTKWPVYLLSLKDQVESGTGRPYPNDIKIHQGD